MADSEAEEDPDDDYENARQPVEAPEVDEVDIDEVPVTRSRGAFRGGCIGVIDTEGVRRKGEPLKLFSRCGLNKKTMCCGAHESQWRKLTAKQRAALHRAVIQSGTAGVDAGLLERATTSIRRHVRQDIARRLAIANQEFDEEDARAGVAVGRQIHNANERITEIDNSGALFF